MRRSRTPATAWPAVADLMTILAVIGLSAAAVVATQSKKEMAVKDSRIVVLKDSIVVLNRKIVGFIPCWPGPPGEKLYFFTYDVTFADERYTLSRHTDFAAGSQESSAKLLTELHDLPTGPVNGARMAEFGRTVSRAINDHAPRYPADCKLAVTINKDADGNDLEPLLRGRFYPVYR